MGLRRAASCGTNGTTAWMSHPPSWRQRVSSRPSWSTASTSSPWKGTSMLHTFDDRNATDRHNTQYFEIFGNRGIEPPRDVRTHRGGSPVPAESDQLRTNYHRRAASLNRRRRRAQNIPIGSQHSWRRTQPESAGKFREYGFAPDFCHASNRFRHQSQLATRRYSDVVSMIHLMKREGSVHG
jgi:hypothetical protein